MSKDNKDHPKSQVGYIKEPYHVPGYTGHIPTKQYRHGASFGNVSRRILEDPSVAQAPIPLLLPPIQMQKDSKISKCSTPKPSSKEQEQSGQPPNAKTKVNCTGNEEDYGIKVYQLPYWPKAQEEASNVSEGGKSPLNVEVQEMLRGIKPLPYLTQRDLNPESPNGTQRGQKDCKGEDGIVERRSIGIQYSDKRDAKQYKKNGKRKEDDRSRKVICNNGRRAANRKAHDCSQIEPAMSLLQCPDAREDQNCNKVSPIKNRSPYVNSSFEDPLDTRIFRPSEGLPAAYTGHVPGKKFRSDGRSFGKVSYETKDFMESYGMSPVN